jgi:hypothetical protein
MLLIKLDLVQTKNIFCEVMHCTLLEVLSFFISSICELEVQHDLVNMFPYLCLHAWIYAYVNFGVGMYVYMNVCVYVGIDPTGQCMYIYARA